MLDPEAWAALPADEKTVLRKKYRAYAAERDTLAGKLIDTDNHIRIAGVLAGREAFFYPHRFDYRGRVYPIPSRGPHPQSSDVGKALIEFAAGYRLGRRGLHWLKVRAATTFGFDKATMDERADWATANAEMILSVSAAPLKDRRWCAEGVEDPWQFLATCFELAAAWELDDPEDFVSHLPVSVDATCSGIQHLSAMVADQQGGVAVNLTPGPRRDIYSDVADVAARMVDTSSDPLAADWSGKVTRSVVKRGTMTTPYGVTAAGMKDQLIAEKRVPEGVTEPTKSAAWFAGVLSAAVTEVVSGASQTMAWFQEVAGALAKAALPLEWETPTGSFFRQDKRKPLSHRVRTLTREVFLQVDGKGEPDVGAQVRGSAPNIVHSFDAAHLRMTVTACAEAGIGSFSFVHDSYGTHAAKMDTMAVVLRETFISIYETDWLGRLHASIAAKHPHVAIPDTPHRGSLDLSAVASSEFFFS